MVDDDKTDPTTSKPLSFVLWLFKKAPLEAGVALALTIAGLMQMRTQGYNLLSVGMVLGGAILVSRAYARYAYKEEWTTAVPNDERAGEGAGDSRLEVLQGLLQRTREAWQRGDLDSANPNLRPLATKWSEKRLFWYLTSEWEQAEWFKTWLVNGRVGSDEYLVSWPSSDRDIPKNRERILVTSRSIVIFAPEKPIRIERTLLLADLTDYEVSEDSAVYDVTIRTASGDAHSLPALKNCPAEAGMRNLIAGRHLTESPQGD